MDYIIEENELKTIINKVNQNIIESKNYQNNLKSITSSFSSSYKTNNTSKIEKVANDLNNNLVNINNNCFNDVQILNKVIDNYTLAKNVSTDYLNNILSNVVGNVQGSAKNKSMLHQATSVIRNRIALIKRAVNFEKEDGYNISSYAEVKNGIIFGKNKSGENSRLYLHNSDGSLNGAINLNTDKAIKNINYNNENNQVVVETIDGEKQTYDINRIERSIDLNKNYEGPDIGKYYATDGEKVVETAKSVIGTPYDWGGVGRKEDEGYDCSGLVAYALTGKHERLGGTNAWINDPETWIPTNDPQPGDVCLSDHHTGIYIGDGQMIHAPDYGQTVDIGPVQSDMIYVKYNG